MAQILIIDDDELLRQALCRGLTIAGHLPTPTPDGLLGLEDLVQNLPDLVLLDLVLREDVLNGLEVLDRIRELHPALPVIIMTGYGTVESAVEAMKRGASDFIEKPFNIGEIVMVIERALDVAAMRREIEYWRQAHDESMGASELLAVAPAMRQVVVAARDLAEDRRVSVLICGESGTGKDALARYIHLQADRRDRPFVEVDCAQGSAGELEEQLFGIAAGPHIIGRPGKCELADGGTLLLGEIGELCADVQGRLWRFVKDRMVVRRGAQYGKSVDVRIIATSRGELAPADDGGTLHADLFFRLSQVSLFLPSLRERPQDIMPFFKAFVREFRADRVELDVDSAVCEQLLHYAWPGNVRELRNVAERVSLLCAGGRIGLEHLAFTPANSDGNGAIGHLVDGLESGGVFDGVMYQLLCEALKRSKGRQAEASRWLGLSRSRFSYRLKQYGIAPQDYA